MTSFLVVSQNEQKRNEHIRKMCNDRSIDQFDITLIAKKADDEGKKRGAGESKSLGIADVRILQQKLFLKPMKSKEKAIIIDQAETMTIEAQNAMLKVLEEPPPHTIIILSAATKEAFLPTILSRCNVQQLTEDEPKNSDKISGEIEEILAKIDTLTISDALTTAERVGKSKDHALEWLHAAILHVHNNIHDGNTTDNHVLHEFHNTYKILKTTNTNPRLAVENMLLTFTTDL